MFKAMGQLFKAEPILKLRMVLNPAILAAMLVQALRLVWREREWATGARVYTDRGVEPLLMVLAAGVVTAGSFGVGGALALLHAPTSVVALIGLIPIVVLSGCVAKLDSALAQLDPFEQAETLSEAEWTSVLARWDKIGLKYGREWGLSALASELCAETEESKAIREDLLALAEDQLPSVLDPSYDQELAALLDRVSNLRDQLRELQAKKQAMQEREIRIEQRISVLKESAIG